MDENLLWARIGHRLGREIPAIYADPSAFLIISMTGNDHRYVQWHGEHDGAFYAEAASGLYSGEPLSAREIAALTSFGWTSPGERVMGLSFINWSRAWLAPVSLYDVVRLTVATLREAFLTNPHQLWESL